MCRGEGEGGGGGSMDEEVCGDMCEGKRVGVGGGSVDQEAPNTCGGGGGMLMNDASTDTSGLRIGGIPKTREGGLMNHVASSDTCDGE